jgi:uncharacterized protein (DUF1800 family)
MRHSKTLCLSALLTSSLAASCADPATEGGELDSGDSGEVSDIGQVQSPLEEDVPIDEVYTVPNFASSNQMSRFLGQATFGPTYSDIGALRSLGSYEAWLQKQFGQNAPSNLTYVAQLAPPTWSYTKSTGGLFTTSFYTNAMSNVAQLRQRVAFALSEIFVISFQNAALGQRTAGIAAYHDLLAQNAFGTYRQLLEAVSTHPMMGLYLSSLRNQKADAARMVMPDENYGREVMQLFSIGLYELNLDGTLKRNAQGKPIETYTQTDVSNLARVFTGWSWACTQPNASPAACFSGNKANTVENRDVLPMEPNQTYHSPEEINFLGLRIEAKAEIKDTLERALDHLAGHTNVGPFFGKQLIQRLVTSNPSAAYVQHVASAFNAGLFTSANNIKFGTGQRGDLQATIAAVLLDPEARNVSATSRLREPILRLTAVMRAFQAAPDAAQGDALYRISEFTAATSLDQSPYRSPSVFNFFRPGYTPPLTEIATNGWVAPEFQIADEVSVAGYANFMQSLLTSGVPAQRIDTNGDGTVDTAFNPKLNFAPLVALADNPANLVNRVRLLLTADRMSTVTKDTIVAAVNKVPLPASGSPAATLDAARLNRARLAIFLTLISPDFLIQ